MYTFYTLYGYLSLKSISSLKVGMAFKQGDLLVDLGKPDVNGDYPGVCSKKHLDFYLNNCPDPNTLLKLEI